MACNANCSCTASKADYRPVCGSDNVTYFSACYAGCTQEMTKVGAAESPVSSSTSLEPAFVVELPLGYL